MTSTAILVRRLALALAALGLVAGLAVYAAAGADSDVDPVMRLREMREVDRLGGTATVQAVRFDGWLGSLWHGQRLGLTLAVLALVVGGACWQVGSLMGEDDLAE